MKAETKGLAFIGTAILLALGLVGGLETTSTLSLSMILQMIGLAAVAFSCGVIGLSYLSEGDAV
jgi:hypothetical protein